MNFYILTLFPEMVMNGLSTSITGRAIESGKLHIEAINIRDYTQDKHNHVDDYPYGGRCRHGHAGAPVCMMHTRHWWRSLAENHGSYI